MSEVDVEDKARRATAMAMERIRESGGVLTASVAGDTDAEVVNGDAPVEELTQLTTIWSCTKIHQFTSENLKRKWRCDWCPRGSNTFTGWNATKALFHVCKISGHGVRPCKGFIPPNYERLYKNFRESLIVNKQAQESKSCQCVILLLNT